MAKAEGLIDAKQREAGLSIAPDMAEVIDTFASLKVTGLTIKDYLAQQALFEERLTPFQRMLLEHLDDIARKPKLVREMLRNTAEKIVDAPPKGQISLLGLKPLTKEEMVNAVINKQRDEIGKPAFQVAAVAPISEELEKPDAIGIESAGRLGQGVGARTGQDSGLAARTSVQVGIPGLGKETAQVKFLEEFGGAPGVAGIKETLIDVEAEKAREAAKPLPGQIALEEAKPDLTLTTEVAMPFRVNKSDIPRNVAERAFAFSSFTPEKRADSVQEDYVSHMESVYDSLEKIAKTDEQKAILKEEFGRYQANYISKQIAVLNAQSRTASPMITGPSKFPTARNQKALNAEQNRRNELLEFDKKSQRAMIKKIDPTRFGISSDRADATNLLQGKIDKAEKVQATMTEANKIVRDKKLSKEQKIEKLQTIEGIGKSAAEGLMEPDFVGRLGFASFQLTNNNANIKRMKERIEQLEKSRGQDTLEITFENGKVIDNVEDNRLQIFFDGKPDRETIGKLKSNGFRWTPSIGAWQRFRSEGAKFALQRAIGVEFKKPVVLEPPPPAPAPIEPTLKSAVEPPQPEPKAEVKPEAKPTLPEEPKKKVAVISIDAQPTMAELLKAHSERGPQSQMLDKGQTHQITITADNPRAKSWLKDQGRMDIIGIDAPNRIKRPTIKTPRMKRPKNVLKSKRSGKIFRTKMKGGTALSRRPLKAVRG